MGPSAQPAIALAGGTVVRGSIEWQNQAHEAVCGRPVQMIEALLREAALGEILVPGQMRDDLLATSTLTPGDRECQGVTTSLSYCVGLRAVHKAGILHHDMKPENVLLEPTGNARLMDFGIAAPLADGEGSQERQQMVGTPYYLAPEQLKGGVVDVRADIFATGILLFELFTGAKPLRVGQNVSEILSIKLKEEAMAPAEAWPEVPPVLADTLARCLAKDPEGRFSSVSDLLAALERVAL